MKQASLVSIRRCTAAALVAAVLVPGALFAQDNEPVRQARNEAAAPAAPAPSRATCERARSDARFLREMQRTDGDVDPFVVLPIRADCAGVGAREQRMADRDASGIALAVDRR